MSYLEHIPPDIVRCIFHAFARMAIDDTPKDLGNLRLVSREARQEADPLLLEHVASGESPSNLRKNLVDVRRACMTHYNTHPKYAFMISSTGTRTLSCEDASKLRARFARMDATLLSIARPSDWLSHPVPGSGRKKRRGWKPALMRVSNPAHLSIMVESGYTKGRNAVLVAVGSQQNSLRNSQIQEMTARASFGPMYCRESGKLKGLVSSSDFLAHKDAALFEYTLVLHEVTLSAIVLFPRINDIDIVCSPGAGASHAAARFALGSSFIDIMKIEQNGER